MIHPTQKLTGPIRWCLGALVGLFLVGCATTSSVDWNKRVGTYSWDDALAELGSPNRVANLEGGVKSAEWIKTRGAKNTSDPMPPSYTRGETVATDSSYGLSAPDKVLRLMFTPDGKLMDWQRNY